MDPAEFGRLVALGLGRAILHLRDHDARQFREVILDACLHNKAYDAQVCGSRAEYMLDIIRESGEPDFYLNSVIQSLADPAGGWDAEQRFRIARLSAQEGNQPARKAMYNAFPSLGESSNLAAIEFIELDGIDGLLFVAAEIGTRLAKETSEWEDESLLLEACQICGNAAVETALAAAARSDKRIQKYLAFVDENRGLRASSTGPNVSIPKYSDVGPQLGEPGAAGIVRQWVKTATDADLVLAAHDLCQETDPKRLLPYLRIFAQRPFPLDVDFLLQLVEQPDGPVPRHALRALAGIEDEKIRRLALRLVESDASNRMYAIDLLIKNFREGDHTRVAAWWDAENEINTLQSFGSSLVNFLIAHPDPATEKALLRKIYERQPCAHCRCSVVERILVVDGLTAELRRECELDSYPEIRDLVRPQTS